MKNKNKTKVKENNHKKIKKTNGSDEKAEEIKVFIQVFCVTTISDVKV